jgi:hypothetical protein
MSCGIGATCLRRSALAAEIGAEPEIGSPEERAWKQAIVDILRHRELRGIDELRVQILDKLECALSLHSEWNRKKQIHSRQQSLSCLFYSQKIHNVRGVTDSKYDR